MTLWPLRFYRVSGDSMLPTYAPGDTLLGSAWFRPRAGQVVVAVHDGRPLIKRLSAVANDRATLLGDNPGRSTDSRHFGPVPLSELKAKILAKL